MPYSRQQCVLLEDTLIRIVSIHAAGNTYRGKRIQGKCDYLCLISNALGRIVVWSTRDTLLGMVYIYFKLGTTIRGREFRLGNTVIWSRAFGVGHVGIQSYLKWVIAIRSALLQISALSGAWLRIKSYSGWNRCINFDNHTLIQWLRD